MKQRKANRLKNYDYSQNNYYYITTCTHNMREYFGQVSNEIMTINNFGEIVEKCWLDLSSHYQNCILDEYVVMPNHFHGIVIIDNEREENGYKPFPTSHGLSEIMRGFKTFSSKRINEEDVLVKFRWQKSFYDRVIRDQKELDNIRSYIVDNPLKWHLDKNNPINLV
ncbi:hypothetical protein BROOK1789C_242 [Bathymodiolus brooksi thiotrophic gill symbiont]|jgi:REP element-mobilizing transposase RayT|nr:hypothetical protein BROOK1789C_242 [Bathymodiolus brooksi thiotrophic gill symbiont]CAC9571640.1 hypothetical protein [uncultured Gammaproteobacteria bacterium]CAC9613047.1 hypothetical protein [uncultured Gammaproteobacteria bacterium]CAC9625079.1 hypothetical protein [uncultured Gammaproteobacteria bacterium]